MQSSYGLVHSGRGSGAEVNTGLTDGQEAHLGLFFFKCEVCIVVSAWAELQALERRHGGGPEGMGRACDGQGWGRGRTREETVCGPGALIQMRQLLLPEAHELVQVPQADQEGGFGADIAPVVLQLGFGEVAGKNGVDHPLPPVQVLLQFPGIFSLTEEQRALVMKGVLPKNTEWTKAYRAMTNGTAGTIL